MRSCPNPSGEQPIHSSAIDVLSPVMRYPAGAMLRVADICRTGERPGLLPIVPRTWLGWVERGLVPQGVKIGGTRAWPIELVLKIAREGIDPEANAESAPTQSRTDAPAAPVAPKVVGLGPRAQGAPAAA